MPAGYMKKYRKKRPRGAKQRYYKAKNKPTLTTRVKRLENNIEKKFDIYLLSNPGESNIPNSQPMTNDLGTASSGFEKQVLNITPVIAQGTNDNQRVGDQVDLKSMDFRVVCSYQAIQDNPSSGKIGKGDIAHCRVMLVWDNDPTYQGTTPSTGVPAVTENQLTWNHVLSEEPTTTETPAVALATFNHDLVDRDHRISVLMDKRFDMVAGTDRSVIRFNLTKKWVRQKFKYLLGQNTVLNRHLKVLYMSNRVSGECPHIYFESKTLYTDP